MAYLSGFQWLRVQRLAVGALLVTGFFLLALQAPAAQAQRFDSIEESGAKTQPFADYEAVYVAPVEVMIPEGRRQLIRSRTRGDRGVSDRDQALKADDLYQDLVSRLQRDFDIVDTPGPGVLTVAATVTEMQSSRPTQEDLGRLVGLSPNSLYAGSAAAVFVLSENDTILATLSDRYSGNLNDGFPRVGIWSDVDRAFTRWARNLNRYLTRN
ncbi:MAG: DUF3313 family protein [Pseudomonadota bacterium]